MQKQKRSSGLKHLWNVVKSNSNGEKSEAEAADGTEEKPPVCSVLVLQVWPSQSSLRGEADGQSFVFPTEEAIQHQDSGIDSVQASPLPVSQNVSQTIVPGYANLSPSVNNARKSSRALLHPDHARIMMLRASLSPTSNREPDCHSVGDASQISGFISSCSSSPASSTTSIAAAAAGVSSRSSDPFQERRRSSTVTARYSLLDALDLEYALMKAARGSIGPYSLSSQKLTFTQSLAFPALARGLADKRSKFEKSPRIDSIDSGLNAFAKVATALVLVLVSLLVFGVVYKYVRT